MEEERDIEERILSPLRKSPLAMFQDAALTIEKMRVAAQVRLSHLKRYGKTCHDTEELLKRSRNLEEWVDGRMADYLSPHPAYWWFSHIKGIGEENIPKILGRIEAFGRYYDVGDLRIPPGNSREAEEYITIKDNKKEVRTGIWVDGIERLLTPSKQRVLAGHAPGVVRKRGEKHSYDDMLKMLFWRVGSSLLRAGLRQKCESCGHLFGAKNTQCTKCSSENFHQVAIASFARFYLNYKEYLRKREEAKETNIIPTPRGRYCAKCDKEVIKKAAKFCPDCNEPLSQKKEPEGVLYEGHLHRMAQRRMQQLFSDMLNVVWRQGLGLPTRQPYAMEFGGHATMILPSDMLDKACGRNDCPICQKYGL